MKIRFTVPGQPIAKSRPKFARVGKFVKTYTPKQSLNFEQKVGYYAAQALVGMDTQLLDMPVKIIVDFFFSRPKSRQRKKNAGLTLPRTVKPDIDNLAKSILDGLNKVAFRDDALVYCMDIAKFEVDELPRTEVQIEYGINA